MKKVFAVTSGCNSDYRVCALFSSMEKAEAFKAAVPDPEYNDIEEYELDPPTAGLLRRGYSVWYVRILKDGTVERADRTGNSIYSVTAAGTHRMWERTKAPACRDEGAPDVLIAMVWAKSQEQAIKIVNEKRTQMIATGEWT